MKCVAAIAVYLIRRELSRFSANMNTNIAHLGRDGAVPLKP